KWGGAACRLAPAGSAPIVGGDRHKIDEPAALDRIMNEMRIAPEPQMDQPFAEFGRDFACRQERPPGGAPSDTRGIFRYNASRRDGPPPVRRDQRVAVLGPQPA